MSSQELLHSINNQLVVVMGRAELLSQAPVNEQTQQACDEIKNAAGKINRLIREYMHRSMEISGN